MPNPTTSQPSPSDDLIIHLVQVLTMLRQTATTQNVPMPSLPPPPPTNSTELWAPDAFDGSNAEDLQPFLLQCQLTFNAYPHQYAMDSANVFFAISYLKKSTLEWFENGIMEPIPALSPVWWRSWPNFMTKLHTHFRPTNPIGNLEIELHHLTMPFDTHLTEYLVRFNTLAAQLAWGDVSENIYESGVCRSHMSYGLGLHLRPSRSRSPIRMYSRSSDHSLSCPLSPLRFLA